MGQQIGRCIAEFQYSKKKGIRGGDTWMHFGFAS